MKRVYIFTIVAAAVILSAVSCRNNRKVELSQDEVAVQKVELADSVLAVIDELAARYGEARDGSDFLPHFILSDDEKLVKPDYLLNPSLASTFVTRRQKVLALGFYSVDLMLRKAYDMPVAEAKEAITKLATELNYPINLDAMQTEPASAVASEEYQELKKRSDLATFWELHFAMLLETEYLFTKNPDLLMGKLTEEQNAAINVAWMNLRSAISALAEYDAEMKFIADNISSMYDNLLSRDIEPFFASKETSIQTYRADRFKIVEHRNSLFK